jgi:UDP-glucose 4-epimerase
MRLNSATRVLVTGGFGFLGGHLLERLLGSGAQVHLVDDLSSNPVPVEVLLGELPHTEALTYDIATVEDYLSATPDRFDLVFHLASVVGPAGVLRHGGRIVASIVNDTYRLAEYALAHHARLVDVSTSEVYGGGREGLCAEDDQKIVPARPSFRLEYAVAKLAAETALVNLHARDGLDVVIVRPFNIAGPRQSGEGGFVLPRFLAQARLRLPLTIFGDGSARRAFSHVEDLADGIWKAGDRGSPGTAYNLGNHENVLTVEELADCVLRVTGSDSEKEFVDPETVYGTTFVEANDKFPAAGRAISELGWRPTKGVEQIVRDTWEYMQAAPPDVFARLAGKKLVEQLVEAQAWPPPGDRQAPPRAVRL